MMGAITKCCGAPVRGRATEHAPDCKRGVSTKVSGTPATKTRKPAESGVSDSPTRARERVGKGKVGWRGEMCRAYKFGDERKSQFLAALEETGMVTTSAMAAGVHTETPYAHRDKDPAFAKAWEDALNKYRDRLEIEAYRRAVVGWDEEVYQLGNYVGTVHKYSDSLLQLKLKRHRPMEYRERLQADLSHTDTNAEKVVEMTPAEREKRIAELIAKRAAQAESKGKEGGE